MTESNSNQEQILITGVSGVIGRIIFNYLTETYPDKYDVYGLDLHMNISIRYEKNHDENFPFETILPVSSDKFIECDITDREKLYEIIEKYQINMIIHLAAVLESDPDLDKILRVNVQGTKNVFEAPGIHRIVYASSIMVVFGYLTREPYLSIYNQTFNDETMLKDLRKLTVDDPPLPDTRTIGSKIYCQSKIIGEQMAVNIVENTSKSIICIRFGGVNIYNKPTPKWNRASWFSHRDACLLIDRALQAPLNISGIYFGVSNNHRRWVDLENAERDLGFIPQDGAEKL